MNLDRGIGTVFSELLGEITALIRNEIRLAKAEAAEKAKSMAIGLALTVAGLFVLILSLVFLLEAAVGGLMLLGLNLALSSLIVGVVILLLGGVAIWLGISRLKIGRLSESRTAQQIKQDAATVRSQVHAL
ncbi:MAG TPA: phage holin family protein [Rhizomicrobium sp.]|nr:phage holin family protein [Rhizomicrobium sp.]